MPWFDKIAEKGSFSSRTSGHAGEYPDVQYVHIKGKGRNLPNLVLIPGWSESYLKYQEVFYDLYEEFGGKVNIYAMDHCSQGISGRWSPHIDRGWVGDFGHYVDDAEHFVHDVVLKGKEKGKSQQFWLLAHSMGGLVAAHCVSRNPGLFDKIILSAPMFDVFGLEGVPSPILRFVAFVGDTLLGKGMDFVPGAESRTTHLQQRAEDGNTCTSCQPRLDCWDTVREKNPVVVVGGVTWGWLHASNKYRLRSDTITSEHVDALEHSDVLLLQPSLDTVVSNPAQNEVSDCVETMELVPIAGSLHEAFFEWDVMRDFMIKRCVEFYKAEKMGKVKTRKGRKPPSRMVRYVMGLLEKAFLW
eukprot:CAMPEP_0118637164 /NCGR_PEP_ID=MMETSP0785-20121206/3008_1 /TAXON_ID=91992 /ORGANISM="Bolidomonas pacifica, Strain CCMP 1866" /LENGTH=356 /DNA_ID=CAMNT_0006528335 /DNA_START=29 /DNA_END=1096 /DNA_ORIENTATION=+